MPIKSLLLNRKAQIFISFFILVYLIFTFRSASVFATSTPLDKAHEDYSYQVTKYIEIKYRYETARSQYLTFKSAASKNEAFGQTQKYLTQIASVYKAYLFLVEERTNAISWDYASTSRDDLIKQLEEDTQYFDKVNQDISNAKTLEDLPPIANEIQNHLETKTLVIAFNILSITDLTKTEYINALFRQNSKIVHDFAQTKEINNQVYGNWQSEIEQMQNNIDKEIEILKKRPQKTGQFSTIQPEFLYDTQKTTDLLTSTKSLLREVFNFI